MVACDLGDFELRSIGRGGKATAALAEGRRLLAAAEGAEAKAAVQAVIDIIEAKVRCRSKMSFEGNANRLGAVATKMAAVRTEGTPEQLAFIADAESNETITELGEKHGIGITSAHTIFKELMLEGKVTPRTAVQRTLLATHQASMGVPQPQPQPQPQLEPQPETKRQKKTKMGT